MAPSAPAASATSLLSGLLLSTALLATVAACKKDETSPAETGKKGSKSNDEEREREPSQRTKLAPFRALVDESARAELDAGGIFVDFGTADQQKYTRGGWNSGWGAQKNSDGISFAEVGSRKVDVDVQIPPGGAVSEIVIRGRSQTAGQVLTVYVDGTPIGDAAMASEWSTLRIPAKELEPGRHNVDFVMKLGGSPRAEIDWAWFSREAGAAEPLVGPRVMPLRIGSRPKRSLVAPSSRSYSFYMQVPEKAVLVADVGSDKSAQFRVSAAVDGAEPTELWSGSAEGDWQEIAVDLASLAGKAARLELSVSGPGGVAGWGEPEIMIAPPGATAAAGGRAKNAIVILIDTVRADTFAPFSPSNKVVTPAYDALAKESTVFLNAYNQENWTKPSVATTLTGTYPSTHNTKTDGAKLPDEVELISEHLKKAGFATAGFVANGYVSEKFGFQRGWDVFKNYIRESVPSEAEVVYGDALEWLKAHKDSPYFLYIQTIDPHVVYRVEREFSDQYYEGDYSGPLGSTVDAAEQIALGKGSLKASEDDLGWLKALYWGEVSYHDQQMGRFIEELKTTGVFDDTVLVITNDHGEELGDHGKFGHGHSLFEELLRAPLLFHFPKVFAAKEVSEVVENVDLMQTVLDVLGQKPMAAADGASLLPLLRGEAVQRPYYSLSEFLDSRRASRVGNYKLIVSVGNYEALYDVVADRGEENDLSKSHPIALRMVEVSMGEGLANPNKAQRLDDISTKRQFRAGEADIDPEMRKQLEALGYFGE